MKKYFIVSDIHSFYNPLINGLKKAGFDKNNENHILVVAGDLFDRGDDSLKVYNFITALPVERRILIRGNHEDMLCDICDRGYLEDFNNYNGTDSTIFQLLDVERNPVLHEKKAFYTLMDKFKETGIYEWIKGPEWQDYLELGKFLIVHSFFPLHDSGRDSIYNQDYESLSYFPSWRKFPSNSISWQESRWGCPYELFEHFFVTERKQGKVLVCGHWRVQDFHLKYENTVNDSHLYCQKGLIGLDACTAVTSRTNVLVIEDGTFKCFDGENQKELNPD
ncbi:MAG: metallophosphoesterase [Bacilli bacterium]